MPADPSYQRYKITLSFATDGRRSIDIGADPGREDGSGVDVQATSSPVFLISGEGAIGRSGHQVILWCAVTRPLRFAHAMSRFARRANAMTFMSLGIASFVFACPNREVCNTIREEMQTVAGGDLRGAEIWMLDDHAVADTEHLPLQATPVAIASLLTADEASRLPSEARWVADELNVLLRESELRSRQWAPIFVPQIESVRGESRACLDDLFRVLEETHTLETQATLNQLKSQLINHCAVLSYLMSQGLSCALPIGTSECYFRRHALLGISQAMQAVAALEGDICTKFSLTALEPIIDRIYSARAPRTTFQANGRYDDVRFRRSDLSVEHADLSQLSETFSAEERSHDRHVTYFSTRHGFKWSGKSITVPSEVLENVAAAPWNILTISHEMLHCHVYSLLSVILGRNPSDHPTDSWLISNIEEYIRWRASRDRVPPANIRDALRYRVFEFTEDYSGINDGSARLEPGDEGNLIQINGFEGVSDALKRLDNAFKMLNEIIVHTLDLNYFYRNNVQDYLRLIWSSWSRVPQVSFSLKQYLVRSLACVATAQQRGSEESRFAWAQEQVRTALRSLSGDPVIATIGEAVEAMYANEEILTTIKAHFFFSLTVVDDVIRYLFIEATNRHLENSGNALRGRENYTRPEMGEIPTAIQAFPLEIAKGYYLGRPRSSELESGATWDSFKILLHLASADQDSPPPAGETNAT